MWGHVKSLVYADKPQTLDHFEDNIRRVIADIQPQMLGKVIENWTSRLDYIRASRGSHMPDIIFQILYKKASDFILSDLITAVEDRKPREEVRKEEIEHEEKERQIQYEMEKKGKPEAI
ncbi:hypothetical protein TNCV_3685291 [Trichonephila clavipes]|nr:hypothetical protein TNCV_3685291 [Trichonephila clavipes]